MERTDEMLRDPIRRREFLGRTAGAAAMGGLGLYGRLAMAAGLNGGHPLAPRAGHFPAQAKHLIVFFMTGRDLAARHVRLQAEAPAGPRQAGHQGAEEAAGLAVRVPAPGRVRQDGQRAVREVGSVRRRFLLPPLGPRRLGRALGGDAGHAHRLGHDPDAQPRLVDQLRPGHAQHGPAVVHRPGGEGARTTGSRSGTPTSCRPATRACG